MEDVAEYRHHGARLVERRDAQWHGVRVELITREADGPCQAAMCVRQHVVSLLCEGDRAGFLNSIANGPSRRVGRDPGWIRVVSAGHPVRSVWQRGRRTYLLAFVDPAWLSAVSVRGGVDVRLADHFDLRDERLGRVLEEVRRELWAPGLCSAVLGEALAGELAVHLIRAALSTTHAPPARGGLGPRTLRSVLALIDRHVAGPLTLREMAAEAGLSVHHFSHAFRQSTGVPPHRYMLDRRLAAARGMLDDPALSLTEVAFRAGFGGPGQFATAFRRAHGMPPSAWRQRF